MNASASLAATITRAASTQTYCTIRLLVDGQRRQDAFRAYGYFRWLDDVLDAETASSSVAEAERLERRRSLGRQQWLLDECLRGQPPSGVTPEEGMLVDLARHAGPADSGLVSYLRHMMLVMAFDEERRGRLVSRAELDRYTRSLAIAVTEATHHFVGPGTAGPQDPDRYRAASAAHILHMLRDTFDDLRAGYYNVPREFLEAHGIGPDDIHSTAYRRWVADRVDLASEELEAGRSYLGRVADWRTRLAGLAYVARFEWLITAIRRDGYRLRPTYAAGVDLSSALRLGSNVVARALAIGHAADPAPVGRGHP
jgi:phytoene/squalene synthetase